MGYLIGGVVALFLVMSWELWTRYDEYERVQRKLLAQRRLDAQLRRAVRKGGVLMGGNDAIP